jgi:branched-chain amino acid transport system permease protein
LDQFFGVSELTIAFPVAAVVAGIFSVVLGRVSLRVSGDHFIIASFGAQIAGLQVIYNWKALSGGGPGAFGLASPTFLGVTIAGPVAWFAFSVAVAATGLVVFTWIARSPFGLAVRAMRDDSEAAEAGGLRSMPLRLSAFALGGIAAAIAGTMYAGYVTVAQVADFTLTVSISLLAAVIAGGPGTIRGSVFGALLFVGIPRLLDQFNVPTGVAGVAQQLVFGVLLVAVVMVMPQGLAQLRLRRGRVA